MNFHDSLNSSGWRRIHSPSWSEVHRGSKQIIENLNRLQYEGNVDLEQDLAMIRSLAEKLETSEDMKTLQALHRYLHDLVAMGIITGLHLGMKLTNRDSEDRFFLNSILENATTFALVYNLSMYHDCRY